MHVMCISSHSISPLVLCNTLLLPHQGASWQSTHMRWTLRPQGLEAKAWQKVQSLVHISRAC